MFITTIVNCDALYVECSCHVPYNLASLMVCNSVVPYIVEYVCAL